MELQRSQFRGSILTKKIEVMKKPKKTVTIRMSEKDIEEFKRISKQLGIKYTTLIRSLAKRGLSDLKRKIVRS